MASDPDDDHLKMLSTNFIENVQDSVDKFVASCANYVRLSAHAGPLDTHAADMQQLSEEVSVDIKEEQEAWRKGHVLEIQQKNGLIKLLTISLRISQVFNAKYVKNTCSSDSKIVIG